MPKKKRKSTTEYGEPINGQSSTPARKRVCRNIPGTGKFNFHIEMKIFRRHTDFCMFSRFTYNFKERILLFDN